MAKKFHINPETGEAKPCTAHKKPCKYGGDESHGRTPEEARQKYEERMSPNTIPARKNSNAKAKEQKILTPVSKIMDTQQLNDMIKNKYVQATAHPDDPNLKILTYTPSTQYEGKWNNVTKQARGLIIHATKEDMSDAIIMERPWKKFFTLQQMTGENGQTAWALGDDEEGAEGAANENINNIDFNAPAEVTDKMDGSLGILYTAPDGKLALSTKGSFSSDQAQTYTRLLRENETFYNAAKELKENNPNTSFMFELTGPENQIVVEYDKEDIVFIGATDKNTGEYKSVNDYQNTWSPDKGLTTTETMSATTLQEALSLPDRPNREGVVVRLLTNDPEKQMQIKIKQDDYKQLHRMMTGFSKNAARDVIKNSKTDIHTIIKIAETNNIEEIKEIAEALAPIREGKSTFHEKLYTAHKEAMEQSILPKAKIVADAYNHVQNLPQSTFEDSEKTAMKEFAHSIKDKPKTEQSQLFAFFRARYNNTPPEEIKTQGILNTMARDI